MLKTICVKTNNKEISEYLLKELEYFELQSIHVSSYKFKVYTNIIIHYKGKNVELFLNKISTLLAYLVIDFYEPSIIHREYNEFVSLLKAYIQTTPSNIDAVHLIYKNQNSILLNNSKNVIQYNDKLINSKYLSDISFSSNDYALNSLLTLLPKKLYIHLIDVEDDFISTLKKIFDDRVYICTECDLCALYKMQTSKYNLNRLKN